MRRREFLGLGLAATLAGALAGLPAEAQSQGDFIVAQLKAQGYGQIDISRTWLGRTRILAHKGNERREIIFNPRTGEILRDYWQFFGPNGGTTATPAILDPDDDGDDDDPEDEGDDDSGGDGGSDGGGDHSGDGGGDDGGGSGGDGED